MVPILLLLILIALMGGAAAVWTTVGWVAMIIALIAMVGVLALTFGPLYNWITYYGQKTEEQKRKDLGY
jgi:hypothetical protein